MEFRDYLVLLAHRDGSDLFLTAGASPAGKFQGEMMPLCLSTPCKGWQTGCGH
jgi:twitching motility protein PilU